MRWGQVAAMVAAMEAFTSGGQAVPSIGMSRARYAVEWTAGDGRKKRKVFKTLASAEACLNRKRDARMVTL